MRRDYAAFAGAEASKPGMIAGGFGMASQYQLALLLVALCFGLSLHPAGAAVFNVRDYGATGKKGDDARPAIQKAIEACAAARGGTVLFPPGEYTSGTVHLRSHVRIEIASGATVFASPDPAAYEFGNMPSKASLFFGEDLEDVAFEGAGTVDGQAEYEWREDDFETGFRHKETMQQLGKPLLRSYPKGFPKREVFPHLVWLGNSRDVKFTGLKWLHSPSWTIALYGCERVRFDGLYVYTSLKDGVWADGIDLDGCKDVSISDCVIETGDDCIIFISTDVWGPARPCENVTVTRCRLSSASAGVKFSEGNRAGVRNVRVSDCVLTNVNRGFVFNTIQGGGISDVVLSNLTIHCKRYDWFWAGDGQPFYFRTTRTSELNKEPAKPGEPPPGKIRNILIRDVVAHAQGSSTLYGHAENWLEGITLENVRLFMTSHPAAPFDYAEHGIEFRRIKNLKLKDVAVTWEKPSLKAWQSALYFEDISGLDLNGVAGRGATQDVPAVLLNNVAGAVIQKSRVSEGTGVFFKALGRESREIRLQGNDLRRAKVPYQIDEAVPAGAVKNSENMLPDDWRP
jgi:hypothetical protein